MPPIAVVEVDTQPDGALLVRWAFAGEAVPVDIAVGETPDRLDHQYCLTIAANQTMVRLPGGGPAGRFVSVTPHRDGPAVIAADRRVLFKGASNFRDLGGYPTRAGAVVRWGLVFRADSLHGLTPDDLTLYHQLGVRTVYDLRSELERERQPSPVPSTSLGIISRPPGQDATPEALEGATNADGEKVLRDVYAGLIEHAAAQIGQLYTGLVSDGGLPAVFHCHGGKDRTGVVAALLLEALGVERGTVLDDYELTARYRVRVQQQSSYDQLIRLGMSPEAAAGVLTTPRWAMAEALGELDLRYGGIDAYLTGPAGMRADAVQALRRLLLAPVS